MNLPLGSHVHPLCRLLQNQHPGCRLQPPAQQHLLLVPARQFTYTLFQSLGPHLQLPHLLQIPLQLQLFIYPLPLQRCQAQILSHRHRVEHTLNPSLCRHVSQPRPNSLCRSQISNIPLSQTYPTAALSQSKEPLAQR